MLKKLNKRQIYFLGFILMMLVMIVYIIHRQLSLDKNGLIGVGKITQIKHLKKSSYSVKYYFWVNGKKVESSNLFSYGKLFKKGVLRVKNGKYYPLKYDSSNPKNSKIIISQKSYVESDLMNRTTLVKGNVEKVLDVSKNYADLRISYKYEEGNFSFRTRLSKDNLPCVNIKACEKAIIDIKVSELFPELNDLYFKSYDRKHLLNKHGFQF